MAECVNCIHHDVCVKLGKPSLYGINKELGCDKHLEVVRCKDCKHFYHSVSSDRDGRCVMFGTYDTDPSVYFDDFCSYGERRTN